MKHVSFTGWCTMKTEERVDGGFFKHVVRVCVRRRPWVFCVPVHYVSVVRVCVNSIDRGPAATCHSSGSSKLAHSCKIHPDIRRALKCGGSGGMYMHAGWRADYTDDTGELWLLVMS